MAQLLDSKPQVIRTTRMSAWAGRLFLPRLKWAARLGIPLHVLDAFGTPGDTISVGTVCRQLAERVPGLRIHVHTKFPNLLIEEPYIHFLNGLVGPLRFTFWYLDLLEKKAKEGNILEPSAKALGMKPFEYKARVSLTREERDRALEKLGHLPRPWISINAMSREMVKVWPIPLWEKLVGILNSKASLVQLGDDREPALPGITSFAGQLDMRASMAVLSHMDCHVGPDSFLMHAANGLEVPSVILFGGSRPVACLGYAGNANLDVNIECGPCWIHTSHGQVCSHGVKCMERISVDRVQNAVQEILARQAKEHSRDGKIPA